MKKLFTITGDNEKQAYEKAVSINNEKYIYWLIRSITSEKTLWNKSEYSNIIRAYIGYNTKQETINMIMKEIDNYLASLGQNEQPSSIEHDGTFTIYIEN
jgi:hypothetical protein